MERKIISLIITFIFIGVISCNAQGKIHGTYYSESGHILKITKDSTLFFIEPNSGVVYDDTLAITKIKKVSENLIELNSAVDAKRNVFFSMRDTAKYDPTLRWDSIRVNFNFPNIRNEKLFVRVSVMTLRRTYKYFSFIYDSNNRSIKVPSEINHFEIQVGIFAPGNFDLNGLYYGIQYFQPHTEFRLQEGKNNIEITIPGIDDAFFYRHYFYGDYARIGENSVTFKGVTYRKKR